MLMCCSIKGKTSTTCEIRLHYQNHILSPLSMPKLKFLYQFEIFHHPYFVTDV